MQPGEVEVHYFVYEDFDDDAAVAKLGPLLDAEEHGRLARMRRPEPWRHFLAAHALRRVAGGEVSSLTHTNGAVAVAVADSGQIGVDIEDLARQVNPAEGFQQFFTTEEWDWIHERDTPERFLRLWTLKEAWSKAIGLGLSANFGEAPAFLWGRPPGLRGTHASRPAEGRPGVWSYEQWVVGDRYVLSAVATAEMNFRLIYRELDCSLQ